MKTLRYCASAWNNRVAPLLDKRWTSLSLIAFGSMLGCASIPSSPLKQLSAKPALLETDTDQVDEFSISDRQDEQVEFIPNRDSNVVTVSHNEPVPGEASIGGVALAATAGTISHSGIPAGEPANCGECPVSTGRDECQDAYVASPLPLPLNGQEYLFDGGDRSPRAIVREDWTADGIEPTETVMYYETLGGEVCIRPTNRVPIYAPRFAAVRQVSGAELSAKAIGTDRISSPVAAGGFVDNGLAGTLALPVGPNGAQQVKVLDGFYDSNQGVPADQILIPGRMSNAVVVCANLEFFTTGLMIDDEIPVLGRVLAAARAWYTPESVEVYVDQQAAALQIDAQRAQDVHVYEIPDKCSMRICKGASHTIANSGDIIRFTIRFDNVGTKPLGNAVLIDSLSSRLAYIEGSQQASVDVEFLSSPNDVGSSKLQWRIKDPVGAGEGGVISFACRVR